MTVGGVANASGLPARARKPEAPAAEPMAAAPGFARTLHERTALTDPRGDDAARLSRSAPLAVAFDRGDLFGRAVALEGNAPPPRMAEPAASPAAKDRAAVVVSGSAAPVEPGGVAAEPAVPRDDPGVAFAPREAAPASAPMARLAAANGPSPGQPREAGPGEPAKATAIAAVPDRAATRPRTREAPLPPPRQDAQRGERLRQEFAAQLAPVNVVVRAAQGIQVAVRVGIARPGEAAEIERAAAAAVRAEGEELTELRLDGEMQRSRQCR